MRQKLRNLVGLLSSGGKGLKIDKDPVAGHVRDARFWVKMRKKLWNLVGLLSSGGKGLKIDKDPVIAGHVRDAGVRRPGIPRIQRRLPPEQRDVRYYRIRAVQPTVQYCAGDTFRPFFIDFKAPLCGGR
jgi:hypothetical protein